MSDESIFAAAIGKAPGPERRAFLDMACVGDDDLRRRRASSLPHAPSRNALRTAPGALLSAAAKIDSSFIAPDPLPSTALRYSEEACRLEPEDGSFLTTLGVAYYRVSNYEIALDVLVRSDKMSALKEQGSIPANLAFLAMAHQQLGHAQEAEAKLQLLRERMKDRRAAQDAQAQGFLREAEELLAKPKPPSSK